MCPQQRSSNTGLFLRSWREGGKGGEELECREGHATKPLERLEPRRGEASAFPGRNKRREAKSRGHSGGHGHLPGWRRDSKAPAAAAGSLISISEKSDTFCPKSEPGPANLITDPDAQRAKVTSNPTQAPPPPRGAALPRAPPGACLHPLPTASPPRPSRRQHGEGQRLIFSLEEAGAGSSHPDSCPWHGTRRFPRRQRAPRASRTPLPPGSAAPAPPPGWHHLPWHGPWARAGGGGCWAQPWSRPRGTRSGDYLQLLNGARQG